MYCLVGKYNTLCSNSQYGSQYKLSSWVSSSWMKKKKTEMYLRDAMEKENSIYKSLEEKQQNKPSNLDHIYEPRYQCCLLALYRLFRELISQAIKNLENPQDYGFQNGTARQEWIEKIIVAIFAYYDKKEMLNKIFKKNINQLEKEAVSIFEKQPQFFKELLYLLSNQYQIQGYNRQSYKNSNYSLASAILSIGIMHTRFDNFEENFLPYLMDYVKSVYFQQVNHFFSHYTTQSIITLKQNYAKKNINDLSFFLILLYIKQQPDKKFSVDNLILWEKENSNLEIVKLLAKEAYPKIDFNELIARDDKTFSFDKEENQQISSSDKLFFKNMLYKLNYLEKEKKPEMLIEDLEFRVMAMGDNYVNDIMAQLTQKIKQTEMDKYQNQLMIACQESFLILYRWLFILIERYKNDNNQYSFNHIFEKVAIGVFSYLEKKQILTETQKQKIKAQQLCLLGFFDFIDIHQIQEIIPLFQGEKSLFYKLEDFYKPDLQIAHKVLDIQIQENDYRFDLGLEVIYLIEIFICHNYLELLQTLKIYYQNNDAQSITSYFKKQKFSKLFIFTVLKLIYEDLEINKSILLDHLYLLDDGGDMFDATKKYIENDKVLEANRKHDHHFDVWYSS